MTETFAVQPQNLDYYNYFVMCNYVFDEPEPVIQNGYTYEENGVLYCASATEKGVYWYSYCRNNPLMYKDPSGDFFILFAAIVGAMSGMYSAINANGYFSFGAVMGGGIAGAAAGALGAGVGSSVFGALGGVSAVGASAGFQAGFAGGFAGGLVGGVASGTWNSWMTGNGFGTGILDGIRSGIFSGLMGGVIGGIAGGLQAGNLAKAHRGNFWTGKRAIFESIATDPIIGNQITEGVGMEYSNEYAKEFSDLHYGPDVKGVGNLYADGSIPQDLGYYKDGDLVFSSKNIRVNGLTIYQGSNTSDVYLFKEAFMSKPQLYLTMGHEYGHAFYNTLPFALSTANQHSNIYLWQYEQASLFNYRVADYENLFNGAIKFDYTYFPFKPRPIKF